MQISGYNLCLAAYLASGSSASQGNEVSSKAFLQALTFSGHSTPKTCIPQPANEQMWPWKNCNSGNQQTRNYSRKEPTYIFSNLLQLEVLLVLLELHCLLVFQKAQHILQAALKINFPLKIKQNSWTAEQAWQRDCRCLAHWQRWQKQGSPPTAHMHETHQNGQHLCRSQTKDPTTFLAFPLDSEAKKCTLRSQDGVGLMGKTASKFCSTQALSSVGVCQH